MVDSGKQLLVLQQPAELPHQIRGERRAFVGQNLLGYPYLRKQV